MTGQTKATVNLPRIDSVNAHFISVPLFIRTFWRYAWKLAYPGSLAILVMLTFRSILRIKPDIVVLNHPSAYSGLIGLLASKLARARVVLDFDDLIAEYTSCVLGLKPSGILSSILILVQWFIADHSDAVIVPTGYLMNEAVRMDIRNVCLIPNGTEVTEEEMNPRQHNGGNSRLVCGMFGRLDDWTGWKTMEAISACLPKDEFQFVVAGEPTPNDEMLGVEYLGTLTSVQMRSAYSDVDVVMIPFKRERFTHAASPLRLFEAAAMGKCIVSSRLRGIEEVFPDGEAILIDSDEPSVWAKSLRDLRNDREMLAQIAERARKKVLSQYTWDSLSQRFEDFLLSILGK